MRIAHLADCHLGYCAFNKVDEKTGLNVRERDFYLSFTEAVDKIIELKPDVVVLAGDLFHTRKPPTQAIVVAQSALSAIQCPIILIPGNHDNMAYRTPSPLVALSLLPQVHLIEQPEFVTIQGVRFYCIPFTTEPPEFREADYLVAHLRDRRVPQFHGSRIEIPESKYKLGMLGDLHMPFEVASNLFYAGATERVSFNQASVPCGFTFYEDGTSRTREFIEVRTRPFVELTEPPQDLSIIKGAVVKCILTSSASATWVDELRKEAFHVATKIVETQSALEPVEFNAPPSVVEAFKEYCEANRVKYSDEAIKLAMDTLQRMLDEK